MNSVNTADVEHIVDELTISMVLPWNIAIYGMFSQ